MPDSLPQILLETNHLLVVVKPVGYLSQSAGTDAPDMVNFLRQYLKQKYHKPGNAYVGLLHRLDRNVGGVMVFAKTSKAAARLSAQIREHKFRKTYLALVEGVPTPQSGHLAHYISKDEETNTAQIHDSWFADSRLAELNYKCIRQLADGNSLLEIELITGRSHQIRAQLSHIGYPIVGDRKYGAKSGREIGLWAYRLEFADPITAEPLTFEAAMPGTDIH